MRTEVDFNSVYVTRVLDKICDTNTELSPTPDVEELLQEYDELQACFALQQTPFLTEAVILRLPSMLCTLLQDMQTPIEDLAQRAVICFAFLCYSERYSQELDNTAGRQALDCVCSILEHAEGPQLLIAALFCVHKQNLPAAMMHEVLCRVWTGVWTVFSRSNNSQTIKRQCVVTACGFLKRYPCYAAELGSSLPVTELLITCVRASVDEALRSEAMALLETVLCIAKDVSAGHAERSFFEWPDLSTLQCFVSNGLTLMDTEARAVALQSWRIAIELSTPACLTSASVLNPLLKIPSKGMRSLATPVRIEAYKCWYAFTLKVTGIAGWEVNAKLVGLLLSPLRRALSPDKETEAQCLAWVSICLCSNIQRCRAGPDALLQTGVSVLILDRLQYDCRCAMNAWDWNTCSVALWIVLCGVCARDTTRVQLDCAWDGNTLRLSALPSDTIFHDTQSTKTLRAQRSVAPLLSSDPSQLVCTSGPELQEYATFLREVYRVIAVRLEAMASSGQVDAAHRSTCAIVIKVYVRACRLWAQFACAKADPADPHSTINSKEESAPLSQCISQTLDSAATPTDSELLVARMCVRDFALVLHPDAHVLMHAQECYLLVEILWFVCVDTASFAQAASDTDGAQEVLKWFASWQNTLADERPLPVHNQLYTNSINMLDVCVCALLGVLRTVTSTDCTSILWRACSLCRRCAHAILKSMALPTLLEILDSYVPLQERTQERENDSEHRHKMRRRILVLHTLWSEALVFLSAMDVHNFEDLDTDTLTATLTGIQRLCLFPFRVCTHSAMLFVQCVGERRNVIAWFAMIQLWREARRDVCGRVMGAMCHALDTTIAALRSAVLRLEHHECGTHSDDNSDDCNCVESLKQVCEGTKGVFTGSAPPVLEVRLLQALHYIARCIHLEHCAHAHLHIRDRDFRAASAACCSLVEMVRTLDTEVAVTEAQLVPIVGIMRTCVSIASACLGEEQREDKDVEIEEDLTDGVKNMLDALTWMRQASGERAGTWDEFDMDLKHLVCRIFDKCSNKRGSADFQRMQSQSRPSPPAHSRMCIAAEHFCGEAFRGQMIHSHIHTSTCSSASAVGYPNAQQSTASHAAESAGCRLHSDLSPDFGRKDAQSTAATSICSRKHERAEQHEEGEAEPELDQCMQVSKPTRLYRLPRSRRQRRATVAKYTSLGSLQPLPELSPMQSQQLAAEALGLHLEMHQEAPQAEVQADNLDGKAEMLEYETTIKRKKGMAHVLSLLQTAERELIRVVEMEPAEHEDGTEKDYREEALGSAVRILHTLWEG